MSSQIGWPEGASAACGRRQPERFADDLRRRGGAEELTAAAGRGAGAAAELRGLFERELAVREARADRLHRAGVFAVGRRQRDAAGHERRTGRSRLPASAIIIAGRPLSHVATPITPRRVGSERIRRPQDDRGVVAVRQAVEHARRALRSSVARIGAVAGKRDARRRAQLLRPPRSQQSDFPVARCDSRGRAGVPSRRADAAVRARGSGTSGRRSSAGLPAHADVLRPAEEVAARPMQEVCR